MTKTFELADGTVLLYDAERSPRPHPTLRRGEKPQPFATLYIQKGRPVQQRAEAATRTVFEVSRVTITTKQVELCSHAGTATRKDIYRIVEEFCAEYNEVCVRLNVAAPRSEKDHSQAGYVNTPMHR